MGSKCCGQRTFRNQRVRVDEYEDVSLGDFGPCVSHRGDVTQFHLEYARTEDSRRFDRGVRAAAGNDNNLIRHTGGLGRAIQLLDGGGDEVLFVVGRYDK